MHNIYIFDSKTWPDELAEEIDAIILESNLDQNSYLGTWDLEINAKARILDYLQAKCRITFWHSTRLTTDEILDIQNNGLRVLSLELIAQKMKILFNLQNLMSEIPKFSKSDLERSINSVLAEGGRLDGISCRDALCLTESSMNIQAETYWGGEVLLRAFEELHYPKRFLEFGESKIIEIYVPFIDIESTVSIRSIPESLIISRLGIFDSSSVTITKDIPSKNLALL